MEGVTPLAQPDGVAEVVAESRIAPRVAVAPVGVKPTEQTFRFPAPSSTVRASFVAVPDARLP